MEAPTLTKQNKMRNRMWLTFAGIVLVCVAVTLISMKVNYSDAVTSMFYQWFHDTYMDFFNCVSQNWARTIYESVRSIYPPLMNLMYMAVGVYLPRLDPRPLAANPEGLWMFYMIHISCSLLYLFGVWLNTEGLKPWQRLVTALLAAVSLPMLFCFERGNSIVLAVALILLFQRLYRSDRPGWRHFGLFLLAVAANMKFWPALFGLVLIREKKWKDALICVFWGLLLFFLPLKYYGGLPTLKLLIENISNASTELLGHGLGYKINWGNFITVINRAFGIGIPLFVEYIFAALVGVGAMLSRRRCDFFLGIALICVGLPAFSYNYNALYLFIPVCAILTEKDRLTVMDWVMIALLALAVSPIGINLISVLYRLSREAEGQHMNLTTLVACSSVFWMSVLFIVRSIAEMICSKKVSVFFPPLGVGEQLAK